MLKGHNIRLEIAEKGDLATIKECADDVEFAGDFEPFERASMGDVEKQYDQRRKGRWFFTEKKDGARIGYIAHFRPKGCIGIGYVLVKGERGGQRNRYIYKLSE